MSVIMDSSPFHQPGDLHRMRSGLYPHALHPVHPRGGVQKRSAPRHRSISTSQVERLHQYALDPANSTSLPSPSVTSQWITPQQSPQPQIFPDPTTIDAFAQWAVPTPPRSDSGVPNVTFDSTDIPVTTGLTANDFDQFQQSAAAASDMSSLGFLLPSQYGSGTIESEPSSYAVDQSYIPPVRMSQSSSTSGPPAFPHTASSSPALYQSKSVSLPVSSNRRGSDLSHSSNPDTSYGPPYRRPSNSYEAVPGADYSTAPSPSMPSISGGNPSQIPSGHVVPSGGASMAPPYNPSSSRSPSLYDSGLYAQPFTTAPSSTQLYASSHTANYPPPFVGSSVNEVLAKPLGSESSIRVLNQRPKPQCWEHGCNGRQFSTFSNLLRHQREKSGTAAKSYCPKCGAEFTRTTARNGHLAHDKCTKQRQSSDD